MDGTSICPCGSTLTFSDCCHPFIAGDALPSSAERLMRSRYSAYLTHDFDYIADTYATKEQCMSLLANCENSHAPISVEEIKASSLNTQWCKLEVLAAREGDSYSEVEFIAYYQHTAQFYAMHECSRFVKAEGKWLYADGQMLGKTGLIKMGRNNSCLCGSGKKFKRCCHA